MTLASHSTQRTRPAEAPFDYHTMTGLSRQAAADSAWTALSAIQNMTPEEQVLGAATLFAAIADRCNLPASELYRMGQRVIGTYEEFHKRANDSLQSLRDYAALRIKGERDVSIS